MTLHRLLTFSLAIVAVLLGGVLPGCADATSDSEGATAGTLIVYCGRTKGNVESVIAAFEQATGITAEVRYGDTAQLAVTLKEEGGKSPADVFWAQDAGALGAVADEGLLAKLPQPIIDTVPPLFRNASGYWVATSGRARVIAYAARPDFDPAIIPSSVLDLPAVEALHGRLGWAPHNGSFQAFVTAMRHVHGDERTRQWVRDMIAAGAKAYPKNTPIIEAIAAGEIDAGLPNHYYLLRFLADDPNYPVAQKMFGPGDVGNLVNVAGIAIVGASDNRPAAERFIEFMLSPQAQRIFAQQVYEYPVIDGVDTSDALMSFDALLEHAPEIDLEALDDLEGTLRLLQDEGAL